MHTSNVTENGILKQIERKKLSVTMITQQTRPDGKRYVSRQTN